LGKCPVGRRHRNEPYGDCREHAQFSCHFRLQPGAFAGFPSCSGFLFSASSRVFPSAPARTVARVWRTGQIAWWRRDASTGSPRGRGRPDLVQRQRRNRAGSPRFLSVVVFGTDPGNRLHANRLAAPSHWRCRPSAAVH
jgi:hypothetical protein